MIEVIGIEPKQMTEGAAGYDMESFESVTIQPNEIKLVRSGTRMAIPNELVGILVPRSSMAIKQGLLMANSVGIIDSDYRGEIMFPYRNITGTAQVIEKGERIGQILFMPAMYGYTNMFKHVAQFSEDTVRGEGGFGHTDG